MSIKNRVARLPRAGVIRLGSKKTETSPGRNLEYFRIDTATFTQEAIDEALGKNPKELRIKFPNVNRENPDVSAAFIFDASYKAYKNASLFCKGDGETAVRAIAKNKIETVSCPCEFLTGKNQICKQRADLRVILCDLPFMGYFQIGTSSWNSINSIQGMIDMYRNILGDTFWTTEFILYKETAMMQGHRQYLLRLKIAPEFISILPTGSAVTASMVFEDDADDEPDPEQEETPEQPAQTAPEPTMQPVKQETPAQTTGESKAPAKAANVPPKSTSTDPTPPSQDEPSQSVQTASPSREITPQRRSKEAHIRNALRRYGELTKSEQTIVELLKEFCDKPIEELDDKDLSPILSVITEACKMAENGEKQLKTNLDFEEDDIQY